MARRLAPEEKALWRRVADTVAPIAKTPPLTMTEAMAATAGPAAAPRPAKSRAVALPRPSPTKLAPTKPGPTQSVQPRRATLARATLDGRWDRRLRKGLVQPDMSIDLHGHTLASAHALLEASLGRAVQRGARVLLVVAGRVRPGPHHDPTPGEARPRGAIRAALADWLLSSDYGDAVLATRPAAPVHGGGGAIYVVLRAPREG